MPARAGAQWREPVDLQDRSSGTAQHSHAGLHRGRLGPVGAVQDHGAPPPGSRRPIRPGALTIERPCLAASPDRGTTRPAWPSGISMAIPVGTMARPPRSSRLARRLSGRVGIALVRPSPGSARRCGAERRGGRSRAGPSACPRGDAGAAKRLVALWKAAAALEHAVIGVDTLVDRSAERIRSATVPRPRAGQAAAPLRSDRRRLGASVRKGMTRRSQRETCSAPGNSVFEAAPCRPGSSRSTLLSSQLARRVVHADFAEHALHGGDRLAQALLGKDASSYTSPMRRCPTSACARRSPRWRASSARSGDDAPSELVLNKVDLLDPAARRRSTTGFPGALQVSAASGEGLDALRERIAELFADRFEEVRLLVPHADGRASRTCMRSAPDRRARRHR